MSVPAPQGFVLSAELIKMWFTTSHSDVTILARRMN